ncbi:hypothetical protein HYW55_06155 [Candidatus Gottesmanbacteria bacterium]|nr:hypothetical protein [Candidatus Gottesmanbacteria bacterium]
MMETQDVDTISFSHWQRLKNLLSRHRLLFLAVGCFFFVTMVFLLLSKQSLPQKPSPDSIPIPSEISPTIGPPPQVYFETYENTASLPVIPDTMYAYTLKKNYSQEEIVSFGQRLSLSEIQSSTNALVVLKNVKNPDSLGMLTFYPQTGGFSYQSFVGIPLEQPIQALLFSLGITDDTVSCPITYKKKDSPGFTFVECHRDWDLAGLPILSALGVVNAPEDQPLSSLAVGVTSLSTIEDENIINTSTNQDGFARPNDFNTMTVAIDKEGKLLSIASNIRWIASRRIIQQEELLSPQQALQQFIAHKSSLSLTLPAGSGAVDIGKVYPGNLAHAKKATITDYVLTYLENHPTVVQTNLVPMYLIRGTALLNSGYTVRFTETIPALADGTTSLLSLTRVGEVAGDSIELGSFVPVTPTATPQPTLPAGITPSPTVTSTPETTPHPTNTLYPGQPTPTPTPKKCTYASIEKYLNPIWDLGFGMGRVGLHVVTTTHKALWYLPWPPEYQLPTVDELLDQVHKTVPDYTQPLVSAETVAKMMSDEPHCPIRLSVTSPTLFIYAQAYTNVAIEPGLLPIYSDPPISKENIWNVAIQENKSLKVGEFIRDFLYYEYESKEFTKPDTSWIIPKSQLAKFVQDISQKLALLPLEEERLLFELRHASFDIDSDYLFIGLISEDEVNNKLPLKITPRPDNLYRLHFFVSSEISPNPENPTLAPINRSQFMILELGAVKG